MHKVVNNPDKIKAIRLLDENYKTFDFGKIAMSRSGKDNELTRELARGTIESDKLNVFLVYTGARKRAPVYSKVPKAVMAALKLKVVKMGAPDERLMALCNEVITKTDYHFPYGRLPKGQDAIDRILGKLFAYPTCCINSLVKNREKYKGLRLSGSKTAQMCAKFGLCEDFLPYFKCSATCKKSKKLAVAVKEYIKLKDSL